MIKRLPIALPQIKADNNSKSLLNEIRQIVYLMNLGRFYISTSVKRNYQKSI